MLSFVFAILTFAIVYLLSVDKQSEKRVTISLIPTIIVWLLLRTFDITSEYIFIFPIVGVMILLAYLIFRSRKSPKPQSIRNAIIAVVVIVAVLVFSFLTWVVYNFSHM